MGNILPIVIVLSSLCFIILLMKRLVRQSRTKTTLFDHKSELEQPPMTYVMGKEEMGKLKGDNLLKVFEKKFARSVFF